MEFTKIMRSFTDSSGSSRNKDQRLSESGLCEGKIGKSVGEMDIVIAI